MSTVPTFKKTQSLTSPSSTFSSLSLTGSQLSQTPYSLAASSRSRIVRSWARWQMSQLLANRSTRKPMDLPSTPPVASTPSRISTYCASFTTSVFYRRYVSCSHPATVANDHYRTKNHSSSRSRQHTIRQKVQLSSTPEAGRRF
jgi:hypothetical protein